MRSHSLSDQLPGEHTGHLAAISWFPSQHWTMNLFGMHIFCQLPSSARYSFYQPMEGWKAESTCQQWAWNSPPLAQESDPLLTELTWPAMFVCIRRASARPPAFLSTTADIPSSLDGLSNRRAPQWVSFV